MSADLTAWIEAVKAESPPIPEQAVRLARLLALSGGKKP